MGKNQIVVGAFSEAQAERLTGVTVAQLRRWARTNFIRPSYEQEGAHGAFARIYSFKDIVSLRVLGQLRNVYAVTMPELRKTAEKLSYMGDARWTSARLYVHRRKVVFDEPESLRKREVTSTQFVAEIPLAVVTTDARQAIEEMNKRSRDQIGKITRNKYVHSRDPVISGTRIPVSAVKNFSDAGYSPERIIEEYPTLSVEDVRAAIAFTGVLAAA